MKASKYNFYLPYKGEYLFFNGITKRFFTVSEKNSDSLITIIQNPDGYKDRYSAFLEKMHSEGFVVEDETDEMNLILERYIARKEEDNYMLMILPTYQCNFKCWYCTQKHQNQNLTDDNIYEIKNHIRRYLLENQIHTFTLSWFGGEPMLSFEQIVDLSSFAQEFCAKYGIYFNNTITTNGALLSEGRLKIMKILDFSAFQITIDGNREEHNLIKKSSKESSYDRTLQNIVHLLEIIPEARLTLRFNYTEKNIETNKTVEDLNECIPLKYRSKVCVFLQKVWQVSNDSILWTRYDELKELFKKSGYHLLGSILTGCYVEKLHYNAIFPTGMIDKCDNLPLDGLRGSFRKDGKIKWSEKFLYDENNLFSVISPCTQCLYLPICWGPCPAKREEMIANEGKLRCFLENPKTFNQRKIIDYCDSLIVSK